MNLVMFGSNGKLVQADADPVMMPAHYRAYPGIEVIDLTKHMNFCLGNVVKYAARADFKGNPLEDLRKARNYLDIEIDRREQLAAGDATD